MSMTGGSKMGFRASNALASIQAFQSSSGVGKGPRASVAIGANMGLGGDISNMDVAQLRNENERL